MDERNILKGRIGRGRAYTQGVQKNCPEKRPRLKWVFFAGAEILAGNQKISPPRKKPKISLRKKRRLGVSIGRQGSIIFRAVSARSAWELWWRMFMSSIAYVLYALMRAVANSKANAGETKKGATDEIAW